MTIKRKNDFVLSILAIITGLYLVFGKITEAEVKTGQGGFFARSDIWLRAMGAAMILVAVILAIRAIVKDPENEEDKKFHFYIDSTVIATVLMLIVYALALPKFGFFISTYLGTLYLMVLYSVKERGHSFKSIPKGDLGKILIKSLIISAIFLVVFWLVFGKLLAVQLPEFSLFQS